MKREGFVSPARMEVSHINASNDRKEEEIPIGLFLNRD